MTRVAFVLLLLSQAMDQAVVEKWLQPNLAYDLGDL
jgi:hypothetical protein